MGSGRCLFFAIHIENGLIDRIFLSNTLINNNVHSIVGNHRKSAFISLPVIIFILSSILLVISVVILFVLD